MFERFTDRARRVLVLAQEEARLLGSGHIGTEHLLLGMIHQGEGAAPEVLESLGVRLEAVRTSVLQATGHADAEAGGLTPFTPRAKKVLELSLRESLQLGHDYVGTEHMLLGLVREGEGVGAQILKRMTGDLARVRELVLGMLPPGGQVCALPGRPGGVSRPAAPATGPRCPSCSIPLAGRLAYRSLRASPARAAPGKDEASVGVAPPEHPSSGGGPLRPPIAPGSEEGIDVVVAYCTSCGCALAPTS